MLKSSEIRIGNYVGATIAGEIHGSLAIHQIKDGKDIDNAKWYFPIDITEEWLDRFGWVKDGDYYNYGDWTILLKGSLPQHDGLIYNRTNINAKFFPKIKYVHKLQNFILENTEKEMTLIK